MMIESSSNCEPGLFVQNGELSKAKLNERSRVRVSFGVSPKWTLVAVTNGDRRTTFGQGTTARSAIRQVTWKHGGLGPLHQVAFEIPI